MRVSPASGRPLATPNQDIVLGCHFLTKDRSDDRPDDKLRTYYGPAEVRAAYDNGVVDLHEHIRVVLPVPKENDANVRVIREEIAYQGLSVIIARRACVTYAKVIKLHRRERAAADA